MAGRGGKPFELCKVCRVNHNQGRRHNHFSSHINNLSAFFSRCLRKHSDVVPFLRNPTLFLPPMPTPTSFWCSFCDLEIHQIGSAFLCGNAIKHLASLDHLKSLKTFLWNNGCGMDRVDSLRISQDDLFKWEIKCKSLKREDKTTIQGCLNSSSLSANNIHNEVNHKNITVFGKNTVSSCEHTFSTGVLPLQFDTNKGNQISLTHPVENSQDLSSKSRDLFRDVYCVSRNNQNSFIINRKDHPPGVSIDENGFFRVDNFTGQTSHSYVMESEGNVHSGEPPLWLSASEVSQIDVKPKEVHTYSVLKGRKSLQLNPKRVGATWADKRKLEMELAKKGQLVATDYSESWLPNFGRVWQSGSRKQSLMEFEAGSNKLPKREPSTSSLVLQPYVSKRMRTNAQESEASFENTDE